MTARCTPCCYPVAEPVAGENPASILKMTARCTPCCYPVAEPVAGENPETIGFSPL